MFGPQLHYGTVTVSPHNTRSTTGGVGAASTFTRAEFAVRGMPGRDYSVHTPSSLSFSVKGGDQDEASKPMIRELTVRDFVTYSVAAGAEVDAGKLGKDGQDNIYLGATLIVPPNAAPGVYSGFVPLTVSY